MKTQHTRGPWFVDMDPIDTATDIRAKYGWNGVETIPNQLLAQMCGKRDGTRDANARLIAAAPDLLEGCKAALNAFEDRGLVQPFAPKAEQTLRDAIAKATGGE